MNLHKLLTVLYQSTSLASLGIILLMLFRILTQGVFIAIEPNFYILYTELALTIGLFIYGCCHIFSYWREQK